MTYKELEKAWVEETGAEVGDMVRICSKAKEGNAGWKAIWQSDMDSWVGTEGVIRNFNDHGISIVKGRNSWTFPFFVLEIVKKEEKTVTIMNATPSYAARVSRNAITFPGLTNQPIPYEKLAELRKALNDYKNQ